MAEAVEELGWPPDRAVEWRQLTPQVGQVGEAVDRPQQMVRRHMVIERELIER